jgi:glycogen debranching enzyme
MPDDIIRHEDRYYIAADSAYADDRAWVLNHADTFAVFDRWGDIQPIGAAVQGIFHCDTRYVSLLQLRIEGQRPVLLSSSVREENEALSVDLSNRAVNREDAPPLPKGVIHVQRTEFVQAGVHYGELTFVNHDRMPHAFEASLSVAADFRDIFEVRGTQRARRGELLPPRISDDLLILSYRGLDGVLRRTEVRFEPTPDRFAHDTAGFRLALEPAAARRVAYTIVFADSDAGRSVPHRDDALGAIVKDLARRNERIADITTSNEQFNHWLNRSQADLVSLVAETPHGPYPYAGVPWYNTAFGRDGILTALEMLWLAPEVARGVLGYVAATQSRTQDPFRDAEPGKIFHEVRQGEMAALGEVPFGCYYGTVDATPLFVVLAGAYYRRTGDLAMAQRMWPHVEAALAWIDDSGDADKDGFVEYRAHATRGLTNQGWKDSFDAVSHEDGTLAEPPIALCEVQGYVYAAWLEAARLARALDQRQLASELDRRAEELRARFDERFWDDALACYVLALDGDKRPCRIRTSNAGQCLWTGIVLPERAASLARTLMSPELYSGWGVRTLSTDAARYNPMSYHNGSVWPHDNALIALGLARYGFQEDALRILQGLFDATLFMHPPRLPELFCGFARRHGEGPTGYPVACSPQAWAVGAAFMLLEACLCVEVLGETRSVRFRRLRLPEYLPHIQLQGWLLGNETCDIEFIRHHHRDVGLNVIKKPADWEIVSIR